MNGYQPDWVGAIAAGIAAVVAFFLTKTIFPRLSGKMTYLVVGFLTLLLSLVLRLLLRHFGSNETVTPTATAEHCEIPFR
jgi:hypothetical protein